MLSIKNIVKQYEHHRALDDVSMEIPEGSVFGLLGPNGAGKTSLIRIINQITAPDSGEVFFKGEKLQEKHIAHIGYLPEERGLYKKMEIGEQILYLSQLKGLSKAESLKRAKIWFEKMDITTWWNKKVEDLSKGMQQKVQFIATVLHEPELLILDEPFSGFDPVNAEIIKNEFLELNRKGTTIIFSSHRMESVEAMCDRIALINKSHKVLEGTVRDIQQQYKQNRYRVRTSEPQQREHVHQLLGANSEVVEELGQLIWEFTLPEEMGLNELMSKLMTHVTLQGLEEIIPSIHDIFIQKVTKA